MKSIKTADLKDGMKFDKPVYMEGENVFVPAGVPVRQKDIDRLTRWEVDSVHTEGSLIVEVPRRAEAEVDITSFHDLPVSDKKDVEAYLHCIDEYDKIRAAVEAGSELDRLSVDETVKLLLEKVRDRRNEMIQLILMGGKIERKISAGVVNVTILSAIMGSVLKYTGHRLVQLATAALLHDAGMVKVPKEILRKKERLTPEEMNQIRTHSVHSYRVITKDLKYPEEIGVIALQHHERWDGQGYPRKIKGDDIDQSSRILAVADAYVSMINNRPHRNSMIGYNAMKNLLNDNGRHFDPKILKAFLESMGIYPIGSIVQLNNSAIGRVVETHPEAPLRPSVDLIIDEHGNQVGEQEVVDLLSRKSLFIVKAVDPKSLAAPAAGSPSLAGGAAG